LTYATEESNRIRLASQTVAPLVGNVAEFLSQDVGIFPLPSWFCQFDLEQLMRGESKARAEAWSIWKELLNLDPEYIAQREGIPLAALKEPEPVPVPVPNPSDDAGIIPASDAV